MNNFKLSLTDRIYDFLGNVDFYGTIYSEGLEESRERIAADIERDPIGLSLDLEDFLKEYEEDTFNDHIDELKEIQTLLNDYARLNS